MFVWPLLVTLFFFALCFFGPSAAGTCSEDGRISLLATCARRCRPSRMVLGVALGVMLGMALGAALGEALACWGYAKLVLEDSQIPSYAYNRVHRSVVVRPKRVDCVERTLRVGPCPGKATPRDTNHTYGLGSQLLLWVAHALADAAHGAHVTIRLRGWAYGDAPYDHWFAPVSVCGDADARSLRQRCNATVHEVEAGLFRWVRIRPEWRAAVDEPYAAVHIRLGDKVMSEYIDPAEHRISRTRAFWEATLDAIPYDTIYVATDDCKWVASLRTVRTLRHGCRPDDDANPDRYSASVMPGLLYDLSALVQSDHFYADYNSNLDQTVARMREFRAVTPLLGGVRSRFAHLYDVD